MAATAATAVASSFSTSMHSLNFISSKAFSNDTILKISSTKLPHIAIVSNSFGVESNLITPISSKWRMARIIAAVAQEEATAVAASDEATTEQTVEEEEAEEVKQRTEEVSNEVQEEENSVNTKLYFGNLPYLCDSAQLAGIIQEYASPELIEVLYDRDSGKSRGFAFVTMSTIEDCETVIKNLDGSEYGGRIMRVNFSNKPRPKGPLYPETEYKLFVGNLAWTVTSDILIQAFQEYGNVAGARVLYDGETGRSRGYGFVSYESKAEMEAALEALDGVEIEGRAMRISLAQGKKS
ncbi:hypothetical protein Leryth_006307 [Lithospermum erythrorhizon]|uniref:RRM domain-containing protein n=1 Tax=Lithospermum erythrorhizon TaxID=34254 RepID=A0AAV3Q2M9_LITER|nr:hypothetical protein Leryth_006307 [Lithospermum erythrorhizon]